MTNQQDYENRIVAFFDILGYKNFINDTQYDLKKRKHLFGIMEYISNIQFDNEKGILALKDIGKEVSVFSDSIVISYPTNYPGCVFCTLIDIIHIQNDLLGAGFLVRGGIDIGPVYHNSNIIFGPAMVLAYEIESKCAIYPRIIVSDRVLNYGYNNPTPQNTQAYEIEAINNLIRTDKDGLKFINNISQESEFDEGKYLDFILKTKNLIEVGLLTIFEPSVKQKYEWLKEYYNSVIDSFTEQYKYLKV